MRFMMLMIPKGYEKAEPGKMPDAEGCRRDDEVQRVVAEGRRAAGAGWPASAFDRRASFVQGGSAKVTDGPFTEAKEVIGGYWMIQVKSSEEAIEWAYAARFGQRNDRGPASAWSSRDFPPDVQEAAAGFPELPKGGLRD